MMKTLFQVSAWNALALGNFDAAVSVRELLRHADTGIGVGAALDGAVILEDGVAYRAMADGKITVMEPETGIAFAAAMAFDENAPDVELKNIGSLESLQQALEPFVNSNRNIFYMIKAGGVFNDVHLCSWDACQKPYPALAEAAKNRHEFCFENTRGNVIAVWCPQYLSRICLPGWHFHYLSSDKTQGGHVLDLSVDRLHMKIHRIERFDLMLPQNPEFAQRDLCEGLSAETAAAAESVKQ